MVPRSRAALLDTLRARFGAEDDVEVIVEMRMADRRQSGNRRKRTLPVGLERRVVPSGVDRRTVERRVPAKLLRRLSGLEEADRGTDPVFFVERLEPAADREDDDTTRLVLRIQAGERELYGEIYARYFDRLYAYLRQLLRDPGEAEDAAQQTFLQALEALRRFDPSRAPFRAWLFVIARNHACNRLARRSRCELFDPGELTLRQEAEAGEVEESAGWLLERRLVREVERLPAAQREVLVLRTIFDMPFDSVAQRLGRRRDDVRTLHSRATRSLRARLQPSPR